MAEQRGATWYQVWTERDDDRADWNGMEACFSSEQEYERFNDGLADLVRSRLGLSRDDVVADLGCGTGQIADRIARHVRSVLAFDYSETMLGVARRRRNAPNVSYRSADLNHFRIDGLGVTKAFSMGAFLYLNSEGTALELLDHLRELGVDSAILDIRDGDVVDQRPRHYDTSLYDHLCLREETITDRFPTATIRRGEFGGYVNGPFRYNLYLPGA